MNEAWSQADETTRGDIGTFAKLTFKSNVMVSRAQAAAFRLAVKRDPRW